MYTPQSRPGLEVELLLREDLVLVSTPGAGGGPGVDPDYVHVDRGPEFHSHHLLAFPEFAGAGIVAGIGWLGLQQVLARGGSGYFPRRVVAGHLAAGTLLAEPGMPSFALPAYVVYPSAADDDVVATALAELRGVVARIEQATVTSRQQPTRTAGRALEERTRAPSADGRET